MKQPNSHTYKESSFYCCPQQTCCNWNLSLLITVDSSYTRRLIPPRSNWYFAVHASPAVLQNRSISTLFLLLIRSIGALKGSPPTQFLTVRHYTITCRGTTFLSKNYSLSRRCRQRAENQEAGRVYLSKVKSTAGNTIFLFLFHYSNTRQKCLPSLLSLRFLSTRSKSPNCGV